MKSLLFVALPLRALLVALSALFTSVQINTDFFYDVVVLIRPLFGSFEYQSDLRAFTGSIECIFTGGIVKDSSSEQN